MIGGIQPDVLGGLAGADQRQDGFNDRILWAFPDPVPDRFNEDVISEEVERGVDVAFEWIDQLRGLDPPLVVRFSAGAKIVWAEWYAGNAQEAESGNLSPSLEGVWAKMPGQVARIASILHVLDAACGQTSSPTTVELVDDAETTVDPFAPEPAPGAGAPRPRPPMPAPNWVPVEVSTETLRAAIRLGEYFKSHARRVHRHFQRGPRDLQTKILSALRERGQLRQTAILEDVLGRNVPAEKLRVALEALEEAGLVRREIRAEPSHPRVTYWEST